LWFAARKHVNNAWARICELGYDANSGKGWFTQGENGSANEENDAGGKYNTYLSSSFDHITGLPIKHDSLTPQYRWPIWIEANKANSIRTNFNFGSYISSVTARDSLAAIGAKPVFISQEDIINTYSDFDTKANPEYQSGYGYPFGIVIHQSIYSWSFGKYRDIIYVRYQVINASADTLRECFLAPAIDPDMGNGLGGEPWNMNSYFGLTAQDSLDCRNFFPQSSVFYNNPAALNLCRQWTHSIPGVGEYGCLGFAFVETPVTDPAGNVIPNDDSINLGGYGPYSSYRTNQLGLTSFRQWTYGNNPPSTTTRYAFVADGLKDHDTTIIADLRLVLSTGPFNLAPHDNVTSTLAIGIARPSTTVRQENKDSVVKLMAFAHEFFENPIAQSGDPNSITIHHFEGAPTSSVKQTQIAPSFEVSIYPNPTTDIIKAHASSNIENIDIQNILGESVMQLKNIHDHDFTLDLSKLVPGTYFIKFVSGSSVVTKKVIRE
jgi:hypothetical protein